LLSHADEDHIGGLIGLLGSSDFTIKEVRLNTDALKGSVIWDDLVYELSKADRSRELKFKTSLNLSDPGIVNLGPTQLQILAPSAYLAAKGSGSTHRSGKRITTNSVSSVIRILRHDKPIILLAGDLDDLGLDDLQDNISDAEAPILVFPHHGGGSGIGSDAAMFTRELCAYTKPQQIIFSIGRNDKYPKEDVIKAIKKWRASVRIACTQLSKQCAAVLPTKAPDHVAPLFSRGLAVHSCCAGTIQIQLDTSEVHPSLAEHENFITLHAPQALCRRVF
jgi:competence protein ComEC